ncbi:MAG TPA: GNAT family N-acetyltransferase, partial [Candidatus Avacidaminococcus intestinavium]|nr:GNAT family N-acetyltransferase [Candidatus Avacidaminococcus intestinavium]
NAEGQGAVTDDVWGLGDTYIKPQRNQMWAAFSPNGQVVGTIAVCTYNNRFEELQGRYPEGLAAEVGRCYIAESLRRQGLGAKLLQSAEQFVREQGYTFMYLHTHHFLPGGYNFWLKNNFVVTMDIGGSYELVHMEKMLK